MEPIDPISLITPRRKINGISAILLPLLDDDSVDWFALDAHIQRLRSDPSAARVVDETSAATQLAAAKLQLRRLSKRVTGKHVELANLRIHVAEYEEREVPAATELRLPDPRPAPLGAKPTVFLCRYGRVLFPDLERLQGDFFEVVRRARGLSPAYFRDHDVGNRELRWQVMDSSAGQIARLDWRRPNAGETLDELGNANSDYRAALERYDAERYYVQFYVWGDSFDVYLEARRQAEEAGFSIGWEAYEIGQSLKFARSMSRAPTPVD
jgi:hypothetical protein